MSKHARKSTNKHSHATDQRRNVGYTPELVHTYASQYNPQFLDQMVFLENLYGYHQQQGTLAKLLETPNENYYHEMYLWYYWQNPEFWFDYFTYIDQQYASANTTKANATNTDVTAADTTTTYAHLPLQNEQDNNSYGQSSDDEHITNSQPTDMDMDAVLLSMGGISLPSSTLPDIVSPPKAHTSDDELVYSEIITNHHLPKASNIVPEQVVEQPSTQTESTQMINETTSESNAYLDEQTKRIEQLLQQASIAAKDTSFIDVEFSHTGEVIDIRAVDEPEEIFRHRNISADTWKSKVSKGAEMSKHTTSASTSGHTQRKGPMKPRTPEKMSNITTNTEFASTSSIPIDIPSMTVPPHLVDTYINGIDGKRTKIPLDAEVVPMSGKIQEDGKFVETMIAIITTAQYKSFVSQLSKQLALLTNSIEIKNETISDNVKQINYYRRCLEKCTSQLRAYHYADIERSTAAEKKIKDHTADLNKLKSQIESLRNLNEILMGRLATATEKLREAETKLMHLSADKHNLGVLLVNLKPKEGVNPDVLPNSDMSNPIDNQKPAKKSKKKKSKGKSATTDAADVNTTDVMDTIDTTDVTDSNIANTDDVVEDVDVETGINNYASVVENHTKDDTSEIEFKAQINDLFKDMDSISTKMQQDMKQAASVYEQIRKQNQAIEIRDPQMPEISSRKPRRPYTQNPKYLTNFPSIEESASREIVKHQSGYIFPHNPERAARFELGKPGWKLVTRRMPLLLTTNE